jgi:filamentous hemagglutinin
MELPELNNAYIETAKITAYLLSEENSSGKSAFFTAFGFTAAQPETLRQALLAHAQEHDIRRISETVHGTKYIIEGELPTPSGRTPLVRSIWIIDAQQSAPRFVTAYPL